MSSNPHKQNSHQVHSMHGRVSPLAILWEFGPHPSFLAPCEAYGSFYHSQLSWASHLNPFQVLPTIAISLSIVAQVSCVSTPAVIHTHINLYLLSHTHTCLHQLHTVPLKHTHTKNHPETKAVVSATVGTKKNIINKMIQSWQLAYLTDSQGTGYETSNHL